ncbi:hypothetical protein OKW46_003361 [Paraburkholderia sp. WSM4179]|nr:hypothetical protein [Paraburkholderia sp. WSM4179]
MSQSGGCQMTSATAICPADSNLVDKQRPASVDGQSTVHGALRDVSTSCPAAGRVPFRPDAPTADQAKDRPMSDAVTRAGRTASPCINPLASILKRVSSLLRESLLFKSTEEERLELTCALPVHCGTDRLRGRIRPDVAIVLFLAQSTSSVPSTERSCLGARVRRSSVQGCRNTRPWPRERAPYRVRLLLLPRLLAAESGRGHSAFPEFPRTRKC